MIMNGMRLLLATLLSTYAVVNTFSEKQCAVVNKLAATFCVFEESVKRIYHSFE